jgi:5-methylcytosine-specific restriction endonuclease McrA
MLPERLYYKKPSGEKCFYCGLEMGSDRTRDHKQPKSRGGGGHGDGNIVHCHRSCNQHKGTMTLEEYRAVKAFTVGLDASQFKFPGESHHPGKRGPERNFV